MEPIDQTAAHQSYKEALQDVERAHKKAQKLGLDMNPFDANLAGAHLTIGEHLYRLQDFRMAPDELALAQEFAQTILNRDSNHAGAFYILARALHLLAEANPKFMRQLPSAIGAYEMAGLKGDPEDIDTNLHLCAALNLGAYINLKLGGENALRAAAVGFERSIKMLSDIDLKLKADEKLELKRQHLRTLNLRGRAYLGRGRLLGTGDPPAGNPIESYEMAQADLDAVHTALTSVEGASPDIGALYTSAEVRFWKGTALAKRDKVDPIVSLADAIKRFEEVILAEDQHMQAHLMIALCHERSVDFRVKAGASAEEIKEQADAAFAALKGALDINEEYADAFELRGKVYINLKKIEEAKKAYEEAWTLDPSREKRLKGAIEKIESNDQDP